jgi:hypothetical protein
MDRWCWDISVPFPTSFASSPKRSSKAHLAGMDSMQAANSVSSLPPCGGRAIAFGRTIMRFALLVLGPRRSGVRDLRAFSCRSRANPRSVSRSASLHSPGTRERGNTIDLVSRASAARPGTQGPHEDSKSLHGCPNAIALPTRGRETHRVRGTVLRAFETDAL